MKNRDNLEFVAFITEVANGADFLIDALERRLETSKDEISEIDLNLMMASANQLKLLKSMVVKLTESNLSIEDRVNKMIDKLETMKDLL